jgi:ABC-type sugar transport system ATPase subunit
LGIRIDLTLIQDDKDWSEYKNEFVLASEAGKAPDIIVSGHEFIASFIDNPPMNMVDVDAASADGQHVTRHESFALNLTRERGEPAARVGKVRLGIRPEDVTVVTGDDEYHASGEVFIVEPLGRDNMLDIRVGQTHVYALCEPEKRLRPGDSVRLRFDTSSLQFFHPQTEQSLLWN